MIRASWGVKRESGRPLAAADIDHYELTASFNATAIVIVQPNPGDTSFIYDANDPGVYNFKLVCVPKRGGKSDPVTASIELFDETKVVVFDFAIEVIAP